MSYVLIAFSRWDEGSVDEVYGPFESLQDAYAFRREHFGEGYHDSTVQRMTMTPTAWVVKQWRS